MSRQKSGCQHNVESPQKRNDFFAVVIGVVLLIAIAVAVLTYPN